MPFPLGHIAIGLATYKTVEPSETGPWPWKIPVFIVFLANLPDVDILIGLLFQGNGNLFHRGPTHSLLFALLAGYLASHAWRLGGYIPRLRFSHCFLIVFSHVLADMVFTTSPVSLLWPFEVHWSSGSSGWVNVVHAVIFDSIQDIGILAGAMAYIYVLRRVRKWRPVFRVPAFARRRVR
ncbi:MAG: metal-dependent hydrolase [Desulfosarcina sp.]|nr:metal-dependent hydrolase [Desulfobacterales bacterium]